MAGQGRAGWGRAKQGRASQGAGAAHQVQGAHDKVLLVLKGSALGVGLVGRQEAARLDLRSQQGTRGVGGALCMGCVF